MSGKSSKKISTQKTVYYFPCHFCLYIQVCLNYLQLKHEKRVINFSSIEHADNHLFSIATTDENPLESLIENELEEEINLAIKRLPAECKTVFEKSRFEGKKYEDIAGELNISINTVKYHIKNALSSLRKDLERFF